MMSGAGRLSVPFSAYNRPGWEVARWIDYQNVPKEVEREHIQERWRYINKQGHMIGE